MVRSSARLSYWFSRRSLGSKLDDSSIILNKSLHQRNPREFGSGNQRNGVWFGVSHYGLDSKRSFHGTGSTYMAARDYYDIIGESSNVAALELKKLYYRKLHPDMNKDEASVESNFQELQKANEALKDEETQLWYEDQIRKMKAEGVPLVVAEESAKAMKHIMETADESSWSKVDMRKEKFGFGLRKHWYYYSDFYKGIFLGICVSGPLAAMMLKGSQ